MIVVRKAQTLRRFGGRQPLCGTGVTSVMLLIFMPSAFNARTRKGPRKAAVKLNVPAGKAA